ncbi:hypothetical protein AB6G82_01445 [Providencia hangzhouensis]
MEREKGGTVLSIGHLNVKNSNRVTWKLGLAWALHWWPMASQNADKNFLGIEGSCAGLRRV